MFKFPRVPVEELNKKKEYYIFPKGTYYFKIENAEQSVSKAGNHQLVLILEITDDEGRKVRVWDYIVYDEKMAWKFHHLCQAIGKEELYTYGEVNLKMLEGCGGKVDIDISKSSGYDPKNKVTDYVPQGTSEDSAVDNDFNDDIPY